MATFYTGVDKERYDLGEKFLPMDQFLLNYTAPTPEEPGGIPNAGVPQPYKGYPSYDAWLAAQRGEGAGGGGGHATDYGNLQPTWTTLPGDPKNYRLSQLERTSDYFPPTTGIGKAKNWFQEKFFQPKIKGTYGTRQKAQYDMGQKLPFFLSKVAGMQSAFNPDSKNYNPNWEDQLNYLEMGDKIGIDQGSGLRKYTDESVLAGQNVFSGFGSNDYEEQLQKKLDWYKQRELAGKKFSIKNRKKAEDEMEAWKNKNKDTTDIITDTITTDDGTIDGGKNSTGDEWVDHGAYGGGEGGIHTGEGTASQTTSTSNQDGGWSPGSGSQGTSQGGHWDSGNQDKGGGYDFADYNQGGRVYLNLGGLASILGREGLAPGGPAGGASAGGDYGGNVNPEQEYAGKTFQETYGGGDGGSGEVPPTFVENKDVVDVDWLTTKPELNINLDRSKYLAQLDLINSIKNQELEGQIGATIGPVDFSTMINEGNIGNTNINYGNWSADISPNADINQISYNKNIGGWDFGANYTGDGQYGINLSKTFKHGGLASIL